MMSEVVIYEKVRSCPYCGAFKKKDGWNYAKQMCGCGFGKIPTPEEIEADDYSTAQVQNMHREITTLTTELTECRAENERLENLLASGVHSCSVHCQRPLCVAQRRIKELEAENAKLREAAKGAVEAYLSYVYGSGDCASGEIETLDKAIDNLAALLEEQKDG